MLQGLSFTLIPYGRTAGSAIVTGLLASPQRATVAVGGGGGWRSWTVCPWGMHHIQHIHTHSLLLPPPQKLHLLLLHLLLLQFLPLEWVSSDCLQQWQAQHREAIGESGAAAAAVVCLQSLMQMGSVKHTVSGTVLWSENHLTACRRKARNKGKIRVCVVSSKDMMTPFGRLPFVEMTGHPLQTWLAVVAHGLQELHGGPASNTSFQALIYHTSLTIPHCIAIMKIISVFL